MKNKIEVQQLTVSYNGNTAIEDISFSFPTGRLIGIIGPNGAGKSTLMKAMIGLIPLDRGTTLIEGKTIKQWRKRIAYVPQRNVIDWNFPITVRDTVLLGTYPMLKIFRRPRAAEKEWAMHCLERVGMQRYAKRQIAQLSGGQQQRVFLARALAQKAEVLFLDEPFVGIDIASEQRIISILKELRDEGKTVFVVHHDITKVTEYFDDLILLNKKLIKAGSVYEVARPEILADAYNIGRELFLQAGVGS